MRIIPDIFQELIIYRPSHPIFTPPLIGTAVISLTEETDAEGLSNIPKVTLSDKTEIGTSKVHALKPLSHYSRWPPFDCKAGTASVFFTICISSTWLMLSNRSSSIYWMSLRSNLTLPYSQICTEVFKKLRAHRQQQPQCLTCIARINFWELHSQKWSLYHQPCFTSHVFVLLIQPCGR